MSLEFRAVSKSFGPKKVLDSLSFATQPGEILFILGKSGTGKSVTLKHFVGILKADSGQVLIDGVDVSPFSEEELGAVRRKCGMVFQHPALLDSLTVEDNVGFGLRALGKTTEERRKRTLECLKAVGLPDPKLLARFPAQISYGTQKRVSMARTLAPGPQYLLFDEPTTGLDPISTQAVNQLIQTLSRTLQVTSLVVSHDMRSALSIADRILVLDRGRLVMLGTPAEIRASREPLIQDFLSDLMSEVQK